MSEIIEIESTIASWVEKCNKFAAEADNDIEVSKDAGENEKKKADDILEFLERKGIHKGYLHCTFESFTPQNGDDVKALKYVKRLAENPVKTFLMLGNTANGKTHLAISAVRESRYGFYTNSKKMLMDYRSVFQGEYGTEKDKLKYYTDFVLLAIDEVDRISATQAERDFLFLVIEERQARKKATILISNKTMSEFAVWVADSALLRRLTSDVVLTFNKSVYKEAVK